MWNRYIFQPLRRCYCFHFSLKVVPPRSAKNCVTLVLKKEIFFIEITGVNQKINTIAFFLILPSEKK